MQGSGAGIGWVTAGGSSTTVADDAVAAPPAGTTTAIDRSGQSPAPKQVNGAGSASWSATVWIAPANAIAGR